MGEGWNEGGPVAQFAIRSHPLCWAVRLAQWQRDHHLPCALTRGKGRNVPFLKGASGGCLAAAGCSGSHWVIIVTSVARQLRTGLLHRNRSL